MPAEWEPTPDHETRARALGLDLKREADTFRAHAAANGRQAVEWNSAFTMWLLKSRPQAAPASRTASPSLFTNIPTTPRSAS